MSLAAMNWAFAQKVDGPSAKMVLLVLADAAADGDFNHGLCWPSHEFIAARSSQSADSVARRIKDLVGLGLVYVGPRKKHARNGLGTNYMVVLYDDAARATALSLGFDPEALAARAAVSCASDAAEKEIPQSAGSLSDPCASVAVTDCGFCQDEQNQDFSKSDAASGESGDFEKVIPQTGVVIPQMGGSDTATVRSQNHLKEPYPPIVPQNGQNLSPRSWEVDWEQFEQAWRWSVSDNRASAKAAMRRMDDPKLRAEALRWVADYIRVQDRQKRALGSARDYLARERFVDLAKSGKPAHAMVWVIKGTPAFTAWEAYKRAKGLCGRAGLFATSVRQPDGSFSTGRYEPSLFPPRENQREGPEARAG